MDVQTMLDDLTSQRDEARLQRDKALGRVKELETADYSAKGAAIGAGIVNGITHAVWRLVERHYERRYQDWKRRQESDQ